MSKFAFKVSFVFLVLFFIGRVVFPFGDEPDFEVRVDRLEMLEKKSFNLYGYFDFYQDIKNERNCEITSGSKSIHSNISGECYELNLKYFFERLGFSFLWVSPLIFFIIFQKKLYFLTKSYKTIAVVEWKRRVDALSLTLLLPSVIYTLGWLSQEVIVVLLSFFVFIFWGRVFLILPLLLFIYTLDNGNGVVVIFFSLILLFYSFLHKLRYKRYLLFGFAIISFALTYFFGQEFLGYLSSISYFSKISEIQHALDNGQYYENYPLILRPVITFMSLIFMTSIGVKSIVLFIIAIIAALTGLAKVRVTNSSLVFVLSALTTIFLITLTIPTHAYAKYYIFLIPFFVYPLLQVYTRAVLLYFFTFLTVITYLNIMIFYI